MQENNLLKNHHLDSVFNNSKASTDCEGAKFDTRATHADKSRNLVTTRIDCRIRHKNITLG